MRSSALAYVRVNNDDDTGREHGDRHALAYDVARAELDRVGACPGRRLSGVAAIP